jgi:hypothetical protein
MLMLFISAAMSVGVSKHDKIVDDISGASKKPCEPNENADNEPVATARPVELFQQAVDRRLEALDARARRAVALIEQRRGGANLGQDAVENDFRFMRGHGGLPRG